VDDEIDIPRERRPQRRLVVRQKVVPTTASFDARTRRQVEAEVRVGKKQDSNAARHVLKVLCRRRARDYIRCDGPREPRRHRSELTSTEV
jgi:hypothetical protein